MVLVMTKYKLVIFDWDGTLLDSIGLITNCIKKVAKELKVPIPSNENVRNFIGYNVDTHLLELFPTIDKEMAVECYRRHYNGKERLVPGAVKTLKLLKQQGAILAIATNNNHLCLNKSLQYHRLSQLFSVVRTTDDGYIKPQAEMALTIIKELNMQSQYALMVGDSVNDMLLARNAGIAAIAVTYGLNSKKDLLNYSPIAYINKLEQLLKFI
jgi:phosphoglycolate phosphatase